MICYEKIAISFMFICACATTYAYPSGIDVSNQQGAYIRANLRTLFGKKEACQNIGRNHVNFPEIYDGQRPDLSRALLSLIKKVNPSYRVHSDSAEANVMTWYNANCVTYNQTGARNSRAVEYFYEYASEF